MRILMVVHQPWDRYHGGAHAQIALQRELESRGHSVEHFALTEAFPRAPRTRWGHLARPHFSRFAEDFVRKHAHRYDVVDALEGCITQSKESLGFDGLLVSRSVGLSRFYEHVLGNSHQVFWAGAPMGKPIVRQVRSWRTEQSFRHCDASLRHADLVNLCNPDEARFAVERLSVPQERVLHLPLGLDAERRMALESARRRSDPERPPQVAFVGFWERRKGSLEWPEIVRQIHARRPDVRFRFLGTAASQETVRRDLGCQNDDRVQVRPRFTPDDLPGLLASASLGMFPSHIEGFPFAVLEMLAAKLPVLAYDAPGTREMLNRLDPGLMTPVGDSRAMATRAVELLGDDSELERLSGQATLLAASYDWSQIAEATARAYEARLTQRPRERAVTVS